MESDNSQGAKFLLTEFSERSQDWRHTDSRIEHALELYLSVCTILVPGSVVSLVFDWPPQLVPRGVALVAIGLAVAALLLAIRIVAADVLKEKYSKALGSVRAYFVHNDPEVTPYLAMRQVHIPGHPLLIHVLLVWCSLLLGFGVTLLLRSPLHCRILVGIGVAVASLVGIVLFVRLRERQFRKSMSRE